ncbi:MAG: M24 family metallopeptidase [Phycisphaerales bacterium]
MAHATAESSSCPLTDARTLRLARLVALLPDAGVDALLVTRECDIRYFTGFCGHDSFLLITGNSATVISDNRYDEQLNPVRSSGAADVVIGMRHRLPESLPALCTTAGVRRIGVQSQAITLAMANAVRSALKNASVVETGALVESLRMCKDAVEIAAIEHAITINEAAMKATLAAFKPGMRERDLGALLEFEIKKAGGDAIGFSPIVAAGAHGSLPHYEVGDTVIAKGESLLLDWGAGAAGYNSDLTRTFGVGSMPAKIREIYQIVLDAQLAAIAAAAPGRICAEIDAVARDHITKAGYGEHFGHGLGHGMGLLVHEAPFFNTLQTDVALEPGMVMTVEPGIYLPGIGGVRIEDDIVITDDGCRVLSHYPKGLEHAILPA